MKEIIFEFLKKVIQQKIDGFEDIFQYMQDHKMVEKDKDVLTLMQDKNGDTLLMLAIRCKNKDFFDFFIKLGTNFNIQNKDGDTALMLAVRYGNIYTVEKLLKVSDVNITNKYGSTALSLSIGSKHLDIFYVILQDKNVDINKPDNVGCTPLRLCIYCLSFFKFYQLIEAGADIDAQDKYGMTCLMFLCSIMSESFFSLRVEMIKLLLKKGCNINLKDRYGKCALDYIKEKNINGIFDEVEKLLVSYMSKDV